VNHDLLVLSADAVHKIPHRGTLVDMSFEDIVRYVSAPLVRERKDSEGGVALGRFRDGVRRLTHFTHTSLIGLDYDDGKLSPEELHAALGDSEHVVYRTFSVHAETGLPKCRVIITLDRPIDLATHRRIMWVVYARARHHGLVLDRACKDATRWWFAPIVHPTRQAAYAVLRSEEGARPWSVDKMLAHADLLDAAEAKRQEEWRREHPPAPPDTRGKASYVAAALVNAENKLSRASTGCRHETLNSEAYSLARLEGCTKADVLAALMPTWRSIAGDEREREGLRTIEDAFKARGR
jgi:hypothetical protein